MASEKFTLFYNGPFCQWHQSPMVIDGEEYNCAEQYMMAQKALLFGDTHSLLAIMATDSPSDQKALGRQVRGFNVATWEAVARDIVMRGSFHKFTSNGRLFRELMSTAGTTLVEASPTDTIWGIGRDELDPLALDRSEWLGRNWLGQVLTDLREQLIVAGLGPRRR